MQASLIRRPFRLLIGMWAIEAGSELHVGLVVQPSRLSFQPLQPPAAEHGVDEAMPSGGVVVLATNSQLFKGTGPASSGAGLSGNAAVGPRTCSPSHFLSFDCLLTSTSSCGNGVCSSKWFMSGSNFLKHTSFDRHFALSPMSFSSWGS